MDMIHLGSTIWRQIFIRTGICLITILPAMIMRSAWRGENRITSAPKRAMS